MKQLQERVQSPIQTTEKILSSGFEGDDGAQKVQNFLSNFGGIGGMILGKGSKLADLDMLREALDMKALGETEDEIFAKTKWWLEHPDGKPRFETSDHGMDFVDYDANQLVDDWLRDSGSETVEQYLKERVKMPGLKGHYDDLDNTKLEANLSPEGYGPEAHVIPGTNKIVMKDWRDPDEFLDIIAHESQHNVQGKEGFDLGGDEGWISEMSSILMARTDELSKIFEWRQIDPATLKKQLYNEGYSFDEIAALEARIAEYTDEGILKEAERMGKELKLLRHTTDSELYQKYLDIAGEEEARLVARRRNMTPEEREARPFYKEYETPLDRQIRIQQGETSDHWKLANFEKEAQ